MKKNLIIFLVSFIFVFFSILLGFNFYAKRRDQNLYNKVEVAEKFSKKKEKTNIDTLEKAISHSKRINFIFLGMEDVRTDTLIFASFDWKNKKVDLISIPRDTYLHRAGYDTGEERKINAVYGNHGIDGVKKAIEYILGGIPIHHFVMMDYEGVAKIVDSVGGVEINVPFHMEYRDYSAKPPLYISIQKGKQLLDGNKTIGFLRYRKGIGGKGGYPDGDLGRIKAQQEFIKAFLEKITSYKLPMIITTTIQEVKTDLDISDGLIYGKRAMGMGSKDFSFMTLPGIAKLKTVGGKTLSYYFYDEKAIREVMEKIYNVEK